MFLTSQMLYAGKDLLAAALDGKAKQQTRTGYNTKCPGKKYYICSHTAVVKNNSKFKHKADNMVVLGGEVREHDTESLNRA